VASKSSSSCLLYGTRCEHSFSSSRAGRAAVTGP